MDKKGWIESISEKWTDADSLIYVGGGVLTMILFVFYIIT